MMKKSFTVFSKIIVLAISAAIIWFGFKADRNLQAISEQFPQTNNKEAVNNNKLNSLLKNDGLTVSEDVLLPAKTEQSNTLHVRFQTFATNDFAESASSNAEISSLSFNKNSGELSRQSILEFSPTLILVTAVNDRKQVLWWNLQPDPRILRIDSVDSKNQVEGKTVYRNDVDMLVSIPAGEQIAELRFYHPKWDGKSYSLENVGNLNIQSEVKK